MCAAPKRHRPQVYSKLSSVYGNVSSVCSKLKRTSATKIWSATCAAQKSRRPQVFMKSRIVYGNFSSVCSRARASVALVRSSSTTHTAKMTTHSSRRNKTQAARLVQSCGPNPKSPLCVGPSQHMSHTRRDRQFSTQEEARQHDTSVSCSSLCASVCL